MKYNKLFDYSKQLETKEVKEVKQEKPKKKKQKEEKVTPELCCKECKKQVCECEQYSNRRVIKVKAKELWIYDDLNWDAKVKTIKKGEIATVVMRYKVGEGYMWKLKSGFFVTADKKYVELIER